MWNLSLIQKALNPIKFDPAITGFGYLIEIKTNKKLTSHIEKDLQLKAQDTLFPTLIDEETITIEFCDHQQKNRVLELEALLCYLEDIYEIAEIGIEYRFNRKANDKLQGQLNNLCEI